LFCRDLKTFLFHSIYGQPSGTRIQIDSVMCPRSSSTGPNTTASCTVTVIGKFNLTNRISVYYVRNKSSFN